MARVKIEMPQNFIFTTEIALRISDINYGGHLGHDSVLTLAHEARVRFFREYGFTELDVFGPGIILSDVAVSYKSECFYGDMLKIEIAVCDYTSYGCDLVYRVSNMETGKDAAYVKTGIVFMNYKEREIAEVPREFKKLFQAVDYKIEIQP
jgi:acyl-CoA thioester hydrolase